MIIIYHNFRNWLMSYWLIFDIDLQMIPPLVSKLKIVWFTILQVTSSPDDDQFITLTEMKIEFPRNFRNNSDHSSFYQKSNSICKIMGKCNASDIFTSCLVKVSLDYHYYYILLPILMIRNWNTYYHTFLIVFFWHASLCGHLDY